ncbi:uncharacterized protein [Lepeophtheirus salmonis]|uniref:uncharacterized protein n=1 Tax=Lepeophtheirus salmonis TaxID=72036 RepID=UPI001AE3612C|nr:larval cuticle protein LCP-17-like [Lepeophtheirus salmonis]
MAFVYSSALVLSVLLSGVCGGIIRSSNSPLATYGSNTNVFSTAIGSPPSFVSNVSPPIVKSRPIINLLSSTYNPPGTLDGPSNFVYSFQSENGIKQEAEGTTKFVGDTEVVVMKGSYEYVGPDGQTYVVDWYADETGYHPSAPHLPQDVPIPYPEIADAVAAQIAFAAANPNDYDDGSYNGNNQVSFTKATGLGSQDIYLTSNTLYSEDPLTTYNY